MKYIKRSLTVYFFLLSGLKFKYFLKKLVLKQIANISLLTLLASLTLCLAFIHAFIKVLIPLQNLWCHPLSLKLGLKWLEKPQNVPIWYVLIELQSSCIFMYFFHVCACFAPSLCLYMLYFNTAKLPKKPLIYHF